MTLQPVSAQLLRPWGAVPAGTRVLLDERTVAMLERQGAARRLNAEPAKRGRLNAWRWRACRALRQLERGARGTAT